MNQVGVTYMRPWGTYKTIEQKDDYQIKYITVLPKKKLSLQYHNYRSEHWTIVKGSGKAIVGTETLLVHAGGHVKIEIQQVHRMINDTEEQLEFIEIQMGSYLGEDDIVRLEDDFGRV